MPLARLRDTTLYYEERGSGPALVFLPGLGATHAMQTPQADAFAASHRVITLDPRGAGRSGRLRGWRRILARQAADVTGLLDALGIERAVVIGVSYGGVLAQRVALAFPSRVAGLVVVDSFCEMDAATSAEFGIMLANFLMAPIYLLPKPWLLPLVAPYRRWPLAHAHLRRAVLELRGWETLKVRYALNAVHYARDLRALPVPMLGVVGANSGLVVRLMRRVAGAFMLGRLEVMPDSFDPTNLCQPEVFNALLREFLQEMRWL